MKHPHQGRMAEVYLRTHKGHLVWVGYTDGPMAGAEWQPWGVWVIPEETPVPSGIQAPPAPRATVPTEDYPGREC